MNRRSFVGGVAAVGGSLLVMRSSAHAQMKEGSSKFIQYLNSTNEHWTASLTGLSGSGLGYSDPDFIHTGPKGEGHHDKWIEYKDWDGNVWHAKCHSHSGLGTSTSFTFEHFRDVNGKPDHEDDTIGFLSWDGTKWLANVPTTGNVQTPANFNLVLHQ